MGDVVLHPVGRAVDAVVEVPGSKSLTNRALAAAALARGASTLRNVLLADDTERMMESLRRLGFEVIINREALTATVRGCDGRIPEHEAQIDAGASGTTMRFCTALAATGAGDYRLDGTPRMRQRPIADLVEALRQLGTRVEFLGREGYPPLIVHASGLRSGTVVFESSPSSQLISAVMLVAPCARGDVLIDVRGRVVSEPYLDMTRSVMERFGVSVLVERDQQGLRIIVPAPQFYQATDYLIEPDASNASYFLAAAAVAGGRVTVLGLGGNSVQGDAQFARVLERMGCRVTIDSDRTTVVGPGPGAKLRGIELDLSAMPDVAQTLAVIALFAEGPTHIRNVANLRIKETDRLSALAVELRRAGATVETQEDSIRIVPPPAVRGAAIQTYDDHRMAMSFALAGLAVEGVVIRDAECTSKTFPDFFERWRNLSGE